MATDWAQEQRDVYNDLLEEGAVFTITRTTQATIDPIVGVRTGEVVTQTFAVPGLIKALGSSQSRYTITWKPNTTVQIGDKSLSLAALTYTPLMGDLAALPDGAWQIMAISTMEPAAVPLLNTVLIRKA